MHWLSRYSTAHHKWRSLPVTNPLMEETYYRPIGLVENMFDFDGTDLEGRADINTHLEAELCTNNDNANLDPETALRRKILLAWTVLRFRHVLLSARALVGKDFLPPPGNEQGGGEGEEGLLRARDRFLIVTKPRDIDSMLKEGSRTIDFLGDHYYSDIDLADFYTHVMNTARVFDGRKNLARLFILPLQPVTGKENHFRFHAISAVAHSIADALSVYRWHAQFLDLLNTTTSVLEAQIAELCSPSTDLRSRLPEAQEDLYPPIPGNQARQRWFWAISRILRHVRRPPAAPFPNPLRRQVPLSQAERMPVRYPAVLDYSRTPPINTYSATATLSPYATSRLHALCRSAGVSVGSGAFAMVAIVMMMLLERNLQQQQQQSPQQLPGNLPQEEQGDSLPFVASFPLNPRPFLTHATPPSTLGNTASESSLILAFSDGLTLPFLPSHLPLENRFRLLAKQASRQLKVYQKRKPAVASNRGSGTAEEQVAEVRKVVKVGDVIGTRSASQMLPQLYLRTLDREAEIVKLKYGGGSGWGGGVQGAYPVQRADAWLGATCGVSSIGDRSGLIAPISDQQKENDQTEREEGFAVFDFREMRCTSRARDGEFLVGIAGDRSGLMCHVSLDGCAIDPVRVQREWIGLMEGLFEHGDDKRDVSAGRRETKDQGKAAKL